MVRPPSPLGKSWIRHCYECTDFRFRPGMHKTFLVRVRHIMSLFVWFFFPRAMCKLTCGPQRTVHSQIWPSGLKVCAPHSSSAIFTPRCNHSLCLLENILVLRFYIDVFVLDTENLPYILSLNFSCTITLKTHETGNSTF